MKSQASAMRALPLAYVTFVAALVVLPHFGAVGYDSLKHTTSELAAQAAPRAWVMRSVFVLLAAGSVVDGWSALGRFPFHRLVLSAFGASLMCTAIWSHTPIDPALIYDPREDQLHSFFSSVTGVAFTVLAVASAFIESSVRRRLLHSAVGIFATVLSMLIFTVPQFAGVWQRVIFLGSFGWMLFFFRSVPEERPPESSRK